MSMLKAEKLSAGYNKEVLSSIDLAIKKYEVVAILGANGSGKSTLLKTLATILKPLKGVVYINGEDVYKMKPSTLAKMLSVTLTEKVDAGFMTGFEVVALGRYPYSDAFGRLSEKDCEEIEKCLEMVNALDLSNKPFVEMSDGERQKIMIARALAQKPEVMLLDEPTSFLDAKHRIEVMLLLRKIAKSGVAVLFTTHDVELAVRVCDRVILLADGRVVCSGTPESVLNYQNLEKIYGKSRAKFSSKLGAFEIGCGSGSGSGSESRSEGKPGKIHIVCGGGSGVNVMRGLARKGIQFTAGVLHEGDVDTCVAEICAFKTVVEKAFEEISDEKFEEALKLVEGVVIDTAFPVGRINRRNLELLGFADEIFSFRKDLVCKYCKVVRVKSVEELLSLI